MANSKVLSACLSLYSMLVWANWANRSTSFAPMIGSVCTCQIGLSPPIRMVHGWAPAPFGASGTQREVLLGLLWKLPPVIHPVSGEATICPQQSYCKTQVIGLWGGNTGRERNGGQVRGWVGWWECPNISSFLGPSLALPLNHFISHLPESCYFNWATKLCHLGK